VSEIQLTPLDRETWHVAFTEGFGYDIIDRSGGVTAEKIPVERDARLMALTPALVQIVLRVAPFCDVAHEIREIIGQAEYDRLVGRKRDADS
jgi:hypothetical protein